MGVSETDPKPVMFYIDHDLNPATPADSAVLDTPIRTYLNRVYNDGNPGRTDLIEQLWFSRPEALQWRNDGREIIVDGGATIVGRDPVRFRCALHSSFCHCAHCQQEHAYIDESTWVDVDASDSTPTDRHASDGTTPQSAVPKPNTSRTAIETSIEPAVITALQALVDHSWETGPADYEQQDDTGRERHVFLALTTVKAWLTATMGPHGARADDDRHGGREFTETAEAFQFAFVHLDHIAGRLDRLSTDPSRDAADLCGAFNAARATLRHVAQDITMEAQESEGYRP